MKLAHILNEVFNGREEPDDEDFSELETESKDVEVPWEVSADEDGHDNVACTIKVTAELEVIPPKLSKGQHIKLSRAINSGLDVDYPEPTRELASTTLVSVTLQDGTILSANEAKQQYPQCFEPADIYAATAEVLHRSNIIELPT